MSGYGVRVPRPEDDHEGTEEQQSRTARPKKFTVSVMEIPGTTTDTQAGGGVRTVDPRRTDMSHLASASGSALTCSLHLAEFLLQDSDLIAQAGG